MQQKRLLAEKIAVLDRLEKGLQWSLDRLPEVNAHNINDPEISERISAIVDRFCKLQDQLVGAMSHAHGMLGEKQRSFQDVVTWAISNHILADTDTWLELRSLRNRLTHEYDLGSDRLPEFISQVRHDKDILDTAIPRFTGLCTQLGLTDNQQTADK